MTPSVSGNCINEKTPATFDSEAWPRAVEINRGQRTSCGHYTKCTIIPQGWRVDLVWYVGGEGRPCDEAARNIATNI